MLVLGLGELWIIILTANRGANGAGELSVLASTDEWMSCWDGPSPGQGLPRRYGGWAPGILA